MSDWLALLPADSQNLPANRCIIESFDLSVLPRLPSLFEHRPRQRDDGG